MNCRQKGCKELAVFRFTWPGENESYACVDCAPKLVGLSQAMSFPLQMIVLSGDDHLRLQELEEVDAG